MPISFSNPKVTFMVITASVLTIGIAVTIGSHIARHRMQDSRVPFWVGLVLSVVGPTFLMALVMETILLFTWNPLVWME